MSGVVAHKRVWNREVVVVAVVVVVVVVARSL